MFRPNRTATTARSLLFISVITLLLAACTQGDLTTPPDSRISWAFSPNELAISSDIGLSGSNNHTLTLTNTGALSSTYTLSSSETWLQIPEPTGTLAAGESTTLRLNITPCETLGMNTSTLNVQGGGSETSIRISRDCQHIQQAAISDITPEQLELVSLVNTGADATVSFKNEGSAVLMFDVRSNADWLSVSPQAGELNAGETQTLTLSTTCANAGVQQAMLTLSSNAQLNNVQIPVTLECSNERFSLLVSADEGGRVLVAGDACDADCTTEVAAGATVMVEAVAEEGFLFAGWQGSDCESSRCALKVTADTSLKANFQPDTSTGFQIQVRFSDSQLSASQQAVFKQAADRWSEIIIADVPDIDVNIQDNDCGNGIKGIQGRVDDLVIDVSAPSIDGNGGVLGSAGPCGVRYDNQKGQFSYPYFGLMRLDKADIDALEQNGQLENVILHEMGHILGIGTLWDHHDLLEYNASSCLASVSIGFSGQMALSAYESMGQTGFIPVENDGGQGTKCGHWDEGTFGNELMTGWLDAGENPLSSLTIASLADLNYTVDMTAADAYSVSDMSISQQSLSNKLDLHAAETIILPKFMNQEKIQHQHPHQHQHD